MNSDPCMHAAIGDSEGASFERSSAGRSSMSPRRRHFDIRFATRPATTSTSLADGARLSWNVVALSRHCLTGT